MKGKGLGAIILLLVLGCTSKHHVKQHWVEHDFTVAEKQYTVMLSEAVDLHKFPRTLDTNGRLKSTDMMDWTGGFFPGVLWYLHAYSGEPKWEEAAMKWTQALDSAKWNTQHHDVGFVMYCSYGNAIKQLKNKTLIDKFQRVLVQSAKSLSTRYDDRVKSIKSWNTKMSWDGQTLWKFPVIMDNMMNLELLCYASRVTGDPQYKNIAVNHALSTMKNHVRKDYSSYHVVNYDPQTGKVLNRQTNQGFADNSTWSRGQAWGIYGFTMMYCETGDERFLNTAKGMADYFIKNPNLPEDKVPYWDFNVNQKGFVPDWDYQPDRYPTVLRDASAGAVAASAMLELSTYDGGKKSVYFRTAEQMLKSLSGPEYLAEAGTNSGFLLKHSVGSLPHGSEVDAPLIYADYYFLEALLRYQAIESNNGHTPVELIY